MSQDECSSYASRMESSSTLSQAGGRIEVYQVAPAHLDYAAAARMAQELGIVAGPVYDADRIAQSMRFSLNPDESLAVAPSFVAEDDMAQLVAEEGTGNVFYLLKNSQSILPDGGAAISEERAQAIAEQFLQKLGLSVPSQLFKVESSAWSDYVTVYWLPDGFQAVDTFTPLLVSITVRADSIVTSMDYMWQDIRPIGTYAAVSEAEAFQRLRRCEAIVHLTPPETPTVGGVRVEYIGYPADGPYQLLLPVYHFSSDLESYGTPSPEKMRSGTTDAWVVAVADDYLKPTAPGSTPTVSP